MLLSSPFFIFVFLPLVLGVYFAVKAPSSRNAVLLTFSLIFYFWSETSLTWVLLASILIAWAFGIAIETARSGWPRQAFLSLGIATSVGLLVYFKYLDFFMSFFLPGTPIEAVRLPVGISFFTFQVISYLVDVYRREFKAERSLSRVALYKSFFPQLIAGPIVRYRDIHRGLEKRNSSFSDFYAGAEKFIIGLSQKVLFADTAGRAADNIFALSPAQLGFWSAVLGAFCFTYQLYYDFAGYSNMAIGLGRVFGFHIPENFNYPHSSHSVNEFWTRWHISLSSWFRDYLYIPLGGNRKGPVRTGFNLFLVFLLCGLWHGASLRFVFWGFYHGFFLAVERTRVGRWFLTSPKIIRTLYCWLVLVYGTVIFRTHDSESFWAYSKTLFGFGEMGIGIRPVSDFISTELVLALAFGWYFFYPRSAPALFKGQNLGRWRLAAVLGCYLLSIIYLSGNSFSPFIYRRF